MNDSMIDVFSHYVIQMIMTPYHWHDVIILIESCCHTEILTTR